MNRRIKRLAAAMCGLLTLAVVAAEPVPLFSGSDSYVDLGAPAALQIPSNQPFTVEGWMLFNSLKTADLLYCKNKGRTWTHTYLLGFYNGKLAAFNTAWRGNFVVSRQVDRWYHVAFSFDGTDMAFYLDGALLGTAAFSFNNNVSHTVQINGYEAPVDINGSMSDVRVWDYARTQAEIQSAMSNRLTGVDSGLLGYWPLNEGFGTNVYDRTAAGSNGILIGAGWTNNVALSEQITGEADFVYARAFTLVDIETGSAKFTNSNEVDVAAFPLPAGCDRYQINQSASPHGIGAEVWTATNGLPGPLTFDSPAADSNIIFYAWFTNTTESATVFRAAGQIRYSQTKPVPVVRLTHSRKLVSGQAVVLRAEEIDHGSSGGETGGEPIPIQTMSLNFVSGPAADATPDDSFVTVSALGSYEVELVVMNAAGNVATSAVCQVEVTAYGGETFTWTGVADADWQNPLNWDLHAVPVADSDVVVASGANLLLTNATPQLASFTMAGGSLTFSNWNTCLSADTVSIIGGAVTCSGPFTDEEMSNRVWFACNTLTLGPAGLIDVNGKGWRAATVAHPSGYGPGGGVGRGQGGGYGGRGGAAAGAHEAGGAIYGSAADPEFPGSGGGLNGDGGAMDGHGGGLVRIVASGRVTVHGLITANGIRPSTLWRSPGGSGGGVYLTCGTVTGSGRVQADGGGSNQSGGLGGGGRIAVVYTNFTAQATMTPAPTVAFSAAGHSFDPTGVGGLGAPGTVYFPDTTFYPPPMLVASARPVIPGFTNWMPDTLTVSNAWVRLDELRALDISGTIMVWGAGGRLDVSNATVHCGADLVLANGGALHLYAAPTNEVQPHGVSLNVGGELSVAENSTLFPYSNPTNGGSALLEAHDVRIAAGGFINADGLGFLGGVLSVHPAGFGPGGGGPRNGGGYGGAGGVSSSSYARGGVYGSSNAPALPGSGGGMDGNNWGPTTGYGGGLVRLVVGNRFTLDGTITANGRPGTTIWNMPGGSGGGVWITCRTLAGAGLIHANGGDGNSSGPGGGGGGGRIAVWRLRRETGEAVTATATAGSGGSVSPAADGTVVWRWLPPTGTTILLR